MDVSPVGMRWYCLRNDIVVAPRFADTASRIEARKRESITKTRCRLGNVEFSAIMIQDSSYEID